MVIFLTTDYFIFEFHLFLRFFVIYQKDMSIRGNDEDDAARAHPAPAR